MIEFAGIINFPVFLAAAVLLNVTPGSDTMYILAHTVSQGKRAGVLSALGITTGGLFHTVAAVCGLSALISAETSLFTGLKICGSFFLIYLGVRAISVKDPKRAIDSAESSLSTRKVYFSGVMTNVLNPKVAIFFLAFIPQFIADDADSIPLAFMMLGATFLTTGTLWSLSLVAFASALNNKIGANQGILTRMSGAVFIGLGVSLLFSKV